MFQTHKSKYSLSNSDKIPAIEQAIQRPNLTNWHLQLSGDTEEAGQTRQGNVLMESQSMQTSICNQQMSTVKAIAGVTGTG